MTMTSKLSAGAAVLLSFGIAINTGKLRGARQYHKEGVPQRSGAPDARTRVRGPRSSHFLGACAAVTSTENRPGLTDQYLSSGPGRFVPAAGAWLSHY